MPTLEQIQANIKKLKVQADALIAKKAQAAVDQIRQIMLGEIPRPEDRSDLERTWSGAGMACGSKGPFEVFDCRCRRRRD